MGFYNQLDMTQASMINRMRILNMVKEYSQISRIELAKIAGLSEAAVSRIIQILIDEGYLLETGYGNSVGGRKPITLELNPDAGYIIGVDFERSKARAMVFDFSGKPCFSHDALIINKEYFTGLYEAIDACIAFLQNNNKQNSLLGIGLGIRGLLDMKKGTILFSYSFSWSNIPLRQIVQDRYRVPVFMDINARLAALGEWSLVYQRSVSDLTYVTTSWGICAGIISGGKLFCGGHGGAGEIGNNYMICDSDGKFKTLEQICGGQTFLETLTEKWEEPCGKKVQDLCGGQLENLTIQKIAEAVKQGDPYCIELAQKAGHILGIGLVNLVTSFDPELIVIGGQLADLGDVFLDPINETFNKMALFDENHRIKLKLSVLGAQASMNGAALLVFQNLFPNTYSPKTIDKAAVQNRKYIHKKRTPLTELAGT
jgi:predicted NBD/HSP70 family sugar kinase